MCVGVFFQIINDGLICFMDLIPSLPFYSFVRVKGVVYFLGSSSLLQNHVFHLIHDSYVLSLSLSLSSL